MVAQTTEFRLSSIWFQIRLTTCRWLWSREKHPTRMTQDLKTRKAVFHSKITWLSSLISRLISIKSASIQVEGNRSRSRKKLKLKHRRGLQATGTNLLTSADLKHLQECAWQTDKKWILLMTRHQAGWALINSTQSDRTPWSSLWRKLTKTNRMWAALFSRKRITRRNSLTKMTCCELSCAGATTLRRIRSRFCSSSRRTKPDQTRETSFRSQKCRTRAISHRKRSKENEIFQKWLTTLTKLLLGQTPFPTKRLNKKRTKALGERAVSSTRFSPVTLITNRNSWTKSKRNPTSAP